MTDGNGTSPVPGDDLAGQSPTGGAAGSAPVLALSHVSKSFGAIRALADVSLELYAGEVHALVGENGAGKSTLVKMIAGVHQPDSGSLLTPDGEILLSGTAAAQDAGIAVIYQEPTLFPDLSVAENMYIGRQPLTVGRRIDRRALRRQAKEIFARLGVALDPDRIARGLSIADQQLVVIGKALSLDARIIVMDEPTAALSAVEVQRLFAVAETLRQHGAALLFISHRLEEVYALCQRATVFRDGRLVLSAPLSELSVDALVHAMVGREVIAREHEHREPGEVRLQVDGLARQGVFTDISFQVRAGEIVALSGLVGAGRSEVARAVFGVDSYDAGSVTIAGASLRAGSPAAAMDAGMALVPEDRRQQGLVMSMSIMRNVTLASLRSLKRHGLLLGGREREFATDWTSQLQVKYGRLTDPMTSLSGGNQQKCVLAKWLSRRPTLLIVDEPTRGIDVATKSEVHRLLTELAQNGVAILMISSELPEVLVVADRILVMREGRLVGELTHAQADEEKVMAIATGQHEPLHHPVAGELA